MAPATKQPHRSKESRSLPRSGAGRVAARPLYLLAGGSNPGSLVRPILAQAKSQAPSIAYIGTASGDDPGFFRRLAAVFTEAGAGEIRLAAMVSPRADLDEARLVLRSADIIFLSGGDVEEGMKHLQQRAMLPELNRLYRAGKIFVGLSAGSIMLTKCWVIWSDPSNDDSAEIIPCLGFAPLLCDVHAEADGWAELQVLLRLVKHKMVGYGIPLGGGLQVSPGGAVKTLGPSVPRFVFRQGAIKQLADLRSSR
jgi:peptidase E